MITIKKKWLVVLLAVIMVLSIVGGTALAQEEYPAAPAIAAELLREAGVKQLGPFVSAVARETGGRNAEFLGIPKDDPGYREAVRDFLVGMDGVPFSPGYVRDMVLWLDASALDLGDGDKVDFWRDESGKGNHARQDNELMQPSYAGSVEGLNGLPAVYFDGHNKRLDVAHDESLDGMEAFSIFAVIIPKLEGGNEFQRIVDKVWNTSYCFYIRNNGNVCASIRTAGTESGLTDWAAGQFNHQVTSGEPYLTMLSWDADVDAANIYLNGEPGTEQSRTGDTLGTNTSSLFIGDRAGSDRSLDGYIAEIIKYERALSESERVSIEKYLMDKYGL